MGDTDERGLVKAFNRYFKENCVNGVAFRRKQSRFVSQHLDLLVLSADAKDLAIEHKSYKTSSSGKLYFSQHFATDTNEDELQGGHQIRRVRDFEIKSGLETYLAVEVRRGRGKSVELYFLDWDTVFEHFQEWDNDEDDARAGFSREWFKENALEAERNSGKWEIPEEIIKEK